VLLTSINYADKRLAQHRTTHNWQLQWETLQERRRIQRLTFMYKILNGQVAVPAANWLIWNYLYVQAEETITNRRCINLEHTLLNTRNPSYSGQSQSGILFLHQLLSPAQYLPSSVGSPLFRRAQPLVADIASGSWRLLSRSRSRQLTHSLSCGVHHSKYAYVPFCTRGKLICVDKQNKAAPASLANTCTAIKRLRITLDSINCAKKLHSWTFAFYKVVWQQIWREVVYLLVLIPASFINPFWI